MFFWDTVYNGPTYMILIKLTDRQTEHIDLFIYDRFLWLSKVQHPTGMDALFRFSETLLQLR